MTNPRGKMLDSRSSLALVRDRRGLGGASGASVFFAGVGLTCRKPLPSR